MKKKTYYVAFSHSSGQAARAVAALSESSALEKAQTRVVRTGYHQGPFSDFRIVSKSVAIHSINNSKLSKGESA